MYPGRSDARHSKHYLKRGLEKPIFQVQHEDVIIFELINSYFPYDRLQ